MQNYEKYKENFFIKSIKQGVRFSLFQAFSSPFAGFGRIIDSLLGIQSDGNMKSFFSLLFGIIPGLVGLVLGQLIQILINTPAYFGHYCIDKPLSLLIGNYDNALNTGYESQNYLLSQFANITVTPAVNLRLLLTTFIHATPKQMDSPFGFYFGLIPEFARFGVFWGCHVVAASTTMLTDYISENITKFYASFSQSSSQKQTNSSPKPDINSKKTTKHRFKRNRNVQAQQKIPSKFINMNLFEVLGTTFKDYEAAEDKENFISKAYRNQAPKIAPDKLFAEEKYKNATDSEKEKLQEKATANLTQLNDVKEFLLDASNRENYVNYFKQNHTHTFFKPGSEKASNDPQQKQTSRRTRFRRPQ